MIQRMSLILARVSNSMRNEEGAVACEYMLVIAGVSVAVIAGVAFGAPSLLAAVGNGVCGAIDTVVPGAAFDCAGIDWTP